MNGKRIILPRTYIENPDYPIIFLAGPIRNSIDWQEKAINHILSKDKEVIIANPRWDASETIRDLAISGNENYFSRQRAWERYYLDLASKGGCVLFWLANAPGYMTRLELGQLMRSHKLDNSTKFCVGADRRFSDIETIEYELSQEAPAKILYSTLEETCTQAIKLARGPI